MATSYSAADSPWRPLLGVASRAVAKSKAQLAREHLERALPEVSAGSYTEAVTWLFAALEAAIVSIANEHGIETHAQHWRKADVARELHRRGLLSEDFAKVLGTLNTARKLAVYEGEEPDLGGRSLVDIAEEVDRAVEAAEA
jgi:hypothetical protein